MAITTFSQQSGANIFVCYSNRIVTILNESVEEGSRIEANFST